MPVVLSPMNGVVHRVLKTADFKHDKKMSPVKEGELLVVLGPPLQKCPAPRPPPPAAISIGLTTTTGTSSTARPAPPGTSPPASMSVSRGGDPTTAVGNSQLAETNPSQDRIPSPLRVAPESRREKQDQAELKI